MSGYPPGEGQGLDSLLAQLRSNQASSNNINLQPSSSYGYTQPQQQQPQYFQPSAAQHFPQSYQHSSPPPPVGYNQQAQHGSAVMSPAESPRLLTPGGAGSNANAERTSSLLNLLKFQPGAGSSPRAQPAPIGTPLPPSREPSMGFGSFDATSHNSAPPNQTQSSDLFNALMGNFQGKPTPAPQFSAALQDSQSTSDTTATEPSANTQNYLLSLLNKPKNPTTITPQLTPAKVYTPTSKPDSQEDVDDITKALEDTNLDFNMAGINALRTRSNIVPENTAVETPRSQGIFTSTNPFDQLAASSPRVRTPKVPVPGASSAVPTMQILKRQGEPIEAKRKMDERSATSSPAHSKRKVHGQSSTNQSPFPEGRKKLEGPAGNSALSKETVAEALLQVGDEADKAVQEALARADEDLNSQNQSLIEKKLNDVLSSKTEQEFEKSAQIAAQSIKKELDKDENAHALDAYPTPVAEVVKEIIDSTAEGGLNHKKEDESAQAEAPDSWESADAEAEDGTLKEEQKAVKVFNFPMRPWTSIVIKELEDALPTFRDDITLDIARLKKEFDQVDRTLVTASNNFIVYGMSKNGGIRVIRQDDGKDGRLFTETHDRIFTVMASTSSADLKESIIGTGISGTVYWALVKDGEGDHLDEDHRDHLEMHGFALTPIQSMDNESPGGVLKTRARKSSSHPNFFAVGRGKFIHIIWPKTILKSFLKSGKDRVVDTEKYLSQYTLKVNTGKAGKDFSFSGDDSTIVSLDKAGRVKFWDIRPLTKDDGRGLPTPHGSPIEIKDPLITLVTTPATEKSWPTSVLLVDKIRPYQRGGPLRYLIVGMKQNHSLQLWDLALGKPVQEIHLPHGKESDAVCSVLYHAQTGMIVVGHPTRNSIYFLHLSAPKYTLAKSMTQADYMQGIVSKSSTIPIPDSTAVISGMREYSFENKGSLRSLDILQTPNSSSGDEDEPTLFELYAMHSKGVTCLNIKQSDLGWTRENKVINPVAAEKEKIITIETLKEIPIPAAESSEPLQPPAILSRASSRTSPKDTVSKDSGRKNNPAEPSNTASASSKPDKKDSANGVTPSGEKTGKGKRRKAASASESTATASTSLPVSSGKPVIIDPYTNSRNGNVSKSTTAAIPEKVQAPASSLDASETGLKDAESRIADEIKKVLEGSLDSFSQDIKADRRLQLSIADGRQEAMLRMVSATLEDNIEVTLTRIVGASIQATVVPAVSEITSKAVNAQIKEHLGAQLSSSVSSVLPLELSKQLPDVIGRALQQPQLLKLMAESLAKSVSFRVEEHFAHLMQNSVTPTFTALAVQTSKKVVADVQRESAAQIAAYERQSQADGAKIEQLMQAVAGLTESISTMAAAQQDFQQRTLRQLSEKRETPRTSGSTAGSVAAGPVAEKTEARKQYEAQLTEVRSLMEQRDFDGAAMAWLHSPHAKEMFIDYFAQFRPDFLRNLNTIVLLTIGSIISEGIDDGHMSRRVAYLDMVLTVLSSQINDGSLLEDARSHIPVIVSTFIQRLEHLFMLISNVDAHDNSLKEIQRMVTTSKRIMETSRMPAFDSAGPSRMPSYDNRGPRY